MSETATLTAVPATVSDPRAVVTVQIYDTPEAIFDAMALISNGANEGTGSHRWVTILTEDGARLDFHIGTPA
jgi:hypothetical protein